MMILMVMMLPSHLCVLFLFVHPLVASTYCRTVIQLVGWHHAFYEPKLCICIYNIYSILYISYGADRNAREVCTLTFKPWSLGLSSDPAVNCHPIVSQTGWFIIPVCTVLRMDVELGVLSVGISWRTLKIYCVLRKEYRRSIAGTTGGGHCT